MAAAATHDLNEETLEQTNGKLPSVELGMKSNNNLPEIERSIKDAINKLKKNNKRADSLSIAKALTTRLGLPDSVLSTAVNEMIASGKIVVKMYGGRESFYVSDEVDGQDSESEGSDFVSPNKVSPMKFSNAFDLETHEPIRSASQSCPPTSSTETVSVSSNMAYDLLNKERQRTQDLWQENTELKLRIKDLELGDRPTSQCHHREPPLTPRHTPFETGDQCPLADDIIEFKKFIHGEVLSLKAQISSRSISDAGRSLSPQPPRSPPDYERMLIKNLEDRILSLENQLDLKQKIIEKLMETPKVDVTPTRNEKEKSPGPKSTSTANDFVQPIDLTSKEGVQTKASKKKNNPKANKNNESSKNTDTSRDQQTVKTGQQKQVENEVQCEQAARSNEDGKRSNTARKAANDNTKKRIFLVGDSIVNGIQEKGLSTKHNIRIRRCPGDTTKDLVDHVKPIARKQPDLVLFHFGTNDITNEVNTEEHMQKAIDHLRKEAPNTDIAVSLCTRRFDQPGADKKIASCNKVLKDICSRNNLRSIDNSNIDESCLGIKKLHLNRKGTSYLANNLKHFIHDI